MTDSWTEADARIVIDDLLRQGVIVRPVGDKEVRVTIGLPEENRKFIEALKKITNKNPLVNSH